MAVPGAESVRLHSQCEQHNFKFIKFGRIPLSINKIIPFRNLSWLGDEIQAHIRVLIPHNQEGLHLGGHLVTEGVHLAIIRKIQITIIVDWSSPVRKKREGVVIGILDMFAWPYCLAQV